MTGLAEREFERILLIKPSSPGDIIHALPVLHGLRVRYPSARIDWLVATPFADLIAADPALDEVVLFDRRRFGRIGRSVRITGEFMSFVHGLRARKYDLVIDLQGLFRSGFMAFATGARERIGVSTPRELAWMFYTHRLPALGPDAHAADRNYAVAGMLGFAQTPMDFSLTITDGDRTAVGRLLDTAGGETDAPCVVMAPATRWQTKCWPAARYGQLAAALRRRHRARTILVGGAADRPLGDEAVRASEGTATNVCGKTSLRQLAALIERADVVVTGDSTPMHIAAALDRPMVALFGPTHAGRTGPHGRLADVLSSNLECSPCYLRRLRQCPHEHACMTELTVSTVAEAVATRLSKRRTEVSRG